MAGDYTRATFRPRRDHAGVLMQQGRVTVDADWNELVELVDRRLRAETVDIIGRCVVPRETPLGFQIGLGGGTLTIGPGRAYVHGILTECHGGPPEEYDRVLGELRGTAPLPYDKQPYFPNAAAVAPLPTTGTHIAYLDVWRREVTALQEPELVEKAIGIDTSTRLQTAWQVRLLEVPAGTTCGSRVEGWDKLTAPSAGRLTTKAVGVPVDDDPCTVPLTGGYRGTENRLYRVEVHDPGPLGTATFKWSRDDASIAFAVTELDTARTKLTVSRVGRDAVARISIGDWVEVTDDWRELNGLPGELRKVAKVDDGDETITLATALPAGAFDPLDEARHTRVTRWDQSGVAVDAANGVVGVPAAAGTAIVLEAGVQVSFDADPAGGDLHVGDYWIFAARTADASVEELVDEPPRGILHHFCRLAVVTFPGSVVDCRTLWPPEVGEGHDCSCDACVTPESHASGQFTIQMAVDQVKATGGRVCLQTGFYFLDRAVRITGAQSVELVGKGWRTILVSAGREPAIVVQGSLGVRIESLTVLTAALSRPGATPTGIAVALRNTIGTSIERCVLLQIGAVRGGETGIATTANPFGVGPRAAGAPLIALDGILAETRIEENVLLGTTGIGAFWGALYTDVGFVRMDAGVDERLRAANAAAEAKGSGYLLTFDLAIQENLFVCFLTGISLEGFTLHVGDTRIARNELLGALRAGIACNGLTLPAMSRVDVVGNLLEVFGFGIVVGTDDTRVADNDVLGLIARGTGTTGTTTPPTTTHVAGGLASTSFAATMISFRRADAIVLAPSIRPSGIDRLQVRGNRVTRVLGNAIAVRTEIRSAQISHNTIQAIGGDGITMQEGSSADSLTVEGNQILDVGVLAQQSDAANGIFLQNGADVAATGNTVHGVRKVGGAWGIGVVDCVRARVAGNDVGDIGVPESGGGQGIVVAGALTRADVNGNSVRRSSDADAKFVLDGEWYGIVMIGDKRDRIFELVNIAPVLSVSRAFLTAETVESEGLISIDAARGKAVVLPRGRASIAAQGNLVDAAGGSPAVLMSTQGSCVFSDNRCFLLTRRAAVAEIWAGALVASDNYLEGTGDLPALLLSVPQGNGFTVSGNLASGQIALNGFALPTPWDVLNVP